MKQVIITLLLVAIVSSETCNTFNNVTASVQDKDGLAVPFQLNGCLNENTFRSKVREISLQNQRVPALKNGSFVNLRYLKRIIIVGSGMKVVEPGCFQNLRKLKRVILTFGSLSKIPRFVFTGTNAKDVYLNNQAISEIESEAFGNMSNLREVYMGRNKMRNWNPDWFTNSPNVEKLDFQYNNIQWLPTGSFLNTPNIEKIFLDFNDLYEIQPKAFRHLHKLKYLGLRYNRLVRIDEKAFPRAFLINSLRIDANRLNYLPEVLLNRLTVKDIYTNGNPWNCACLENINKWVLRVNGTVRNDVCKSNELPVCIYHKDKICVETKDDVLTKTFFRLIDPLRHTLNEYCVRFDY